MEIRRILTIMAIAASTLCAALCFSTAAKFTSYLSLRTRAGRHYPTTTPSTSSPQTSPFPPHAPAQSNAPRPHLLGSLDTTPRDPKMAGQETISCSPWPNSPNCS